MIILLYFVTTLSHFITIAESLECYQCSNVTSTKDCTSKVTCPQEQKCYTSTHGVGTSQTFDLGCKSENDCFHNAGLGIVGRSTDSQNTCSQCCQVDNCNGNLCSIGLQVINEIGQCADDSTFDCAGVSAVFNICTDVHRAKLKCRKYCGLCNLVHAVDPVFVVPDPGGATPSGSISEDETVGTPILTLEGQDSDGDTLSFSIVSQVPNLPPFVLESGTGLLKVPNGIDAETTRSFNFTFGVKDVSTTVNSIPYIVSVTDVNDNFPIFNPTSYTASILDSVSDGVVVSTVTATDADVTATVTYSISSDPLNAFAVASNGEVRVATSTNLSPGTVTLVVRATSGPDTTDANVTITISDAGLPVAFRASYISNRAGSSGRTLIYTYTEINVGGGYDNTTGIFTAPETGIYSFDVYMCGANNQRTYFVSIVKDGHPETTFYLVPRSGFFIVKIRLFDI